MGRHGWPEMPLILGRSGTQYVATVTKLLKGRQNIDGKLIPTADMTKMK